MYVVLRKQIGMKFVYVMRNTRRLKYIQYAVMVDCEWVLPVRIYTT